MVKVIICSEEENGPLEHPLLRRENVELLRFKDTAKAFIKLMDSPFDIFIWEQTLETEEALVFLDHIQKAAKDTRLKVICCWKGPIPNKLPPVVCRSFSFPPDEKDYGEWLSNCLNAPARKARRVLIRVRLLVEHTGAGTLCSTINVSREGLLIESNKSLRIGGIYIITFLGLGGKPLQPFKTRIIRRDAPPRGKLSLHYYAGTFEDVPENQRDALEEALKL